MKRIFGIVLAVVATFAYTGPAAATNAAEGAVVIPLVSESGDVTQTARAGFDLSATTDGAELDGETSTGAWSTAEGAVLVDAIQPEGIMPLSSDDSDQLDEISSELESEYVLLTDPIAVDEPFAVAGVTWDTGATLPAGSTVQMRTLDANEWSEWYILEVSDDGPEGSRPGTEYNVSGSSSAIQVRITRGSGDLPAGLRVDISYSTAANVTVNEGDEVAQVLPDASSLTDEPINTESDSTSSSSTSSVEGILTSVNSVTDVATESTAASDDNSALLVSSLLASTASIQPRSAWGADESIMMWDEEYADFEGVIVHHTAGSNTYTQSEVASVIRGIYRYHAITRGWGDIGYNVLIDRFGGRWEGRSGTLESSATQMVVGGHAKPRNTGTVGISVMGNFTEVNPNSEIITALEDVISWKFIESGVDPSSESPLTVPDSKSTSSELEVGDSLPRIAGHLDVYWTACPARIYNYLDEIRSAVAKKFDDSLTRFYLNDNWTGTANIEFWWGAPSDEVLVGDWDGDGVDTLTVRRGKLYYVQNTITANLADKIVAYGKTSDDVFVGKFSNDAQGDSLAVRRNNIYYISYSVHGGEADRIVAYGRVSDETLVGDWDGDGVDSLGVRRTSY